MCSNIWDWNAKRGEYDRAGGRQANVVSVQNDDV